MAVSILVLLRANEDGETFNALHFTTLPSGKNLVSDVARIPRSAAQFRFADGVYRDVFGDDGSFPDQSIDLLPTFPLGQGKELLTKEPEGKDGNNRKQDALKPQRARRVEAGEYADDNSPNSEKDNIEATGREELCQKEKKAE
jgi:hypothetical protein